MVDDTLPSFVYYVNHILRDVIPCRVIGEVFGDCSIESWSIKNNVKRVFSISSSQILTVDLSSLSKLAPEAVVGHNPFKGLVVSEIELVLSLLDVATSCIILAIPTRQHHEITPEVIYSVKEWREILEQLGIVVVIYHCDAWSLFLVIK